MKKTGDRFGLIFLIGILILFYIFTNRLFHATQNRPIEMTYSQFKYNLKKGNIKEVLIDRQNIKGVLKNDKLFETSVDTKLIPSLTKELEKHKVEVKFKKPQSVFLTTWLPQIVFTAIIFILFILFIRSMHAGGSQALSFGKSRAKVIMENKLKTTFNDVAGIDEAKEELKEIVEFLKNPKKFQAIGAKIPRGVLLLGPPGTGKTLLARAIAGEAGVPFFSISGSNFVEMFVGVGAARVRDLFEQAKRHAPCLVFIDELDAVGRHRGAGLGGGHDEREQTLNQLLVEMDGFDPNTGVILLAATNRPDILDPALLRPGRFDRRIVIDKPDIKGRRAILDVHTRNKKLSKGVDLDIIARGTPGFSGADLENLVNEAALLAARKNKKEIEMEDLEEAKERVIAGPEKKSRVISEKEKQIIAYHECGHALVAKLLPNTDPVHKISILPRGMALGYTLQLPIQDKYLISKQELIEYIMVMLGGRCAEEIIFDDVTTGAASDLERATETVREMICRFGMSEKLGPLTFGKKHGSVFLGKDLVEDRNYSEEVASAIDKEAKEIVNQCYTQTKELLTKNKESLIRLTKILIERETLEGEELKKILQEILNGQDKSSSEEVAIKKKVKSKFPSTKH